MKKFLFLLGLLFFIPLFSQNKERAVHIILQSVDSSYFDNDGIRYSEFSLTPRKYFKVMDLMKSDTTCNCIILEGHKPYVDFITINYGKKVLNKFDKNVIGYLECDFDGYFLNMWIFENESFGFTSTKVL